MPNPARPGQPVCAGRRGTSHTLKIRNSRPTWASSTVHGPAVTPPCGLRLHHPGAELPGRTFNLRQNVARHRALREQADEQRRPAAPPPAGGHHHRLGQPPGNLGGRARCRWSPTATAATRARSRDGLPDAWSSPDVNKDGMPDYRGRLFSASYTFDNSQEAAHLVPRPRPGRDPPQRYTWASPATSLHPRPERGLPRPVRPAAGLPYELPICIQDRQFKNTGAPQLPGHRPGQPGAQPHPPAGVLRRRDGRQRRALAALRLRGRASIAWLRLAAPIPACSPLGFALENFAGPGSPSGRSAPTWA